MPVGWDAAGDKLIVFHLTEGNFDPLGWLEVLSWPSGGRVIATDSSKTTGSSEITFDRTGQYLAYLYTYQDATGAWNMDVEVTDLNSGSVASIPIAGDPSKVGGGYVWNSQSQIMTVSESELTLTTYKPDGTQLKQMTVPQAIGLSGSTNGDTIFRSVDKNDDRSDIRILQGDSWSRVPMPDDGAVTNVFLSPDGSQLGVAVGSLGSYAPQTAYVADVNSQ